MHLYCFSHPSPPYGALVDFDSMNTETFTKMCRVVKEIERSGFDTPFPFREKLTDQSVELECSPLPHDELVRLHYANHCSIVRLYR